MFNDFNYDVKSEIHCLLRYPDTDLYSLLIISVLTYITNNPDSQKSKPPLVLL